MAEQAPGCSDEAIHTWANGEARTVTDMATNAGGGAGPPVSFRDAAFRRRRPARHLRGWFDKRIAYGAANHLSLHIHTRCFDLLSGSWSKRRANHPVVARTSVLVAHVRTIAYSSLGLLSPRCTGLSRVWSQ